MCVCDGKDPVDDLGGKTKGVVKAFPLVAGGAGVQGASGRVAFYGAGARGDLLSGQLVQPSLIGWASPGSEGLSASVTTLLGGAAVTQARLTFVSRVPWKPLCPCMKLLRCAGRLRTLSFVFPGEKQEERSAGVGAGRAASQSGSRWACRSDRSRQQRAGGASARIPGKLGFGGKPALRAPCSLHTAPCLRRTPGGSGAKSSRAWADSGAQREATPASPATALSHVAAPLPCCYSPGHQTGGGCVPIPALGCSGAERSFLSVLRFSIAGAEKTPRVEGHERAGPCSLKSGRLGSSRPHGGEGACPCLGGARLTRATSPQTWWSPRAGSIHSLRLPEPSGGPKTPTESMNGKGEEKQRLFPLCASLPPPLLPPGRASPIQSDKGRAGGTAGA